MTSEGRSATVHDVSAEGDPAWPCWLYTVGWDLHHPGGVNEVIRNQFDLTVAHLQHRPLLVVHDWNQRRLFRTTIDGRRTIRARWPSPWARSGRMHHLLSFLIRLPRALAQLRSIVRSEHVTVVQVHFPGIDAIVWPLLRLTTLRPFEIILSFHGFDSYSAAGAQGVERLIWRLLLRSADYVTVCSDKLRERLTGAFPPCGDKVQVIENGVDVAKMQRLADTRPASVLPEDFVFSAGTYERKKGHDVLMVAFDRVAARWPDLALVIAGRYENVEYRRLDALRRSLPAADRIYLLPGLSHDETIRIMARARCFALASREEPFGIVVLEAGALARPVICTNVCGVATHLRNGQEIVTVPPDDAAALADALAETLGNPDLARSRGANLRQSVSRTLDWNTVIRHYARFVSADE